MKNWVRNIGGALLMGTGWAVVWAPVAVVIGTLIIDPDNSMDEMWPAIGAYPGFLCAVVFYALHRIAGNTRKLWELSLSRCAAWGALSALPVGLLPFALGTPSSEPSPWLLGVGFVTTVIVLSAGSAVVSALIARMARKRAGGEAVA